MSPEEIRHEDNDYLYECICILNRCEKYNDEELKAFEESFEDKPNGHSILFSLVAVIIVSPATEDVAAFTAYQTSESLTAYYTKNQLSNDTEVQVN